MPSMTQEVWGCGLRFWISHKFPGDAAGPRKSMALEHPARPVLALLSVASGHVDFINSYNNNSNNNSHHIDKKNRATNPSRDQSACQLFIANHFVKIGH